MRNRWSIVPVLALLACSTSHRDTSASLSASSPTSGNAGPGLSGLSTHPGPPRPSPRATDPLWIGARDPDPAARQRLAGAVGAAGLLEGVDDGGEVRDIALSALPYADDADIALAKLADLAQAEGPPRRSVLLETILAIAGQPRRARELLDPEGVRRSGEIMIALASRDTIPREDRAIAISAARALAEKGYLDPVRIPTDLDPK